MVHFLHTIPVEASMMFLVVVDVFIILGMVVLDMYIVQGKIREEIDFCRHSANKSRLEGSNCN